MHIPENYLSPSTCAVLGAAMLPVWGVTISKIKKNLPREKLPMLGVGAACSFLMMMFNVPLPGGTTGHAVGGTLLAILFGPEAACVSVSVALLIQALLFGDGGILAFGANCFNMAFVLPFVGCGIYRLLRRWLHSSGGDLIAAAVGAWTGLNAAALCAAIQFGIQPLLFTDGAGSALYCPYPLSVSIPAMLIPHMLVAGVVEAVFTVGILAFVRRTAPELEQPQGKRAGWPVFAMLGALIVATPLGLLAQGDAWGEWGVEDIAATGIGYTPAGLENGFSLSTIMPDYSVAGLPEVAGYLVSAVAGVAILLIVFKLVGTLKGKHSA